LPAVTVELIRNLREQTGAGISDCKRALEDNEGDLSKAVESLRQKGFEQAARRSDRATSQGLVEAYIHTGGRVGALVELGCETDFVARTPEFRELAHNVAMQVAAMAPQYIDTEDIPAGEDLDPQEACLLHQPYIKDPTITVQDMVKEAVAKMGENVQVRRFARFSLGE
jgi:elongation factor Ts